LRFGFFHRIYCQVIVSHPPFICVPVPQWRNSQELKTTDKTEQTTESIGMFRYV